MLSICPKCGAYHADDSLAFCLADGTPLINVDPGSDSWSEGTRAIEEKGNALRKQQRKMRWRRVLMSMVTTMISIVVVCVVAINGWIYLSPTSDEPQSPLPTAVVNALPTPLPLPLEFPLSIPSPTPSPSPSPSPTIRPSPSPRRNSNVNVNSNGNSNVNVNLHVDSNVNTNTNVNTNVNTNTNSSGDCSPDDKERERVAITKAIPAKLAVDFGRADIISSAVEYQVTFRRPCLTASVKVVYEWQGKNDLNSSDKKFHLRRTIDTVKFDCNKEGVWRCRRPM